VDSDGRTRRANEGIVNMNVSKNSGCLLGLACWNLHRATAEQRYVRLVGNCGGSIVTVEQFSVCNSNWCVQNWLYKYESMGGLALNHGTFSPPTQHPTHCSLRRAPEGGRLPTGIASHKIAKALANGKSGWGKLAHSRTLSGRSAGQS
jgi:hypothetical protein